MSSSSEDFLSIESTTQLRGAAIILVLLGHTGVLINSGPWGVSIFLILSGFGLTQSYLRKGLSGYITNKLSRVILPYTLVTLVLIMVDGFVLNIWYGVKTTILALMGLSLRSPVDNSMWYISYLIIWYMAFYVLFKLPLKDGLKIVGLIITGMLCYIGIKLLLPSTKVIANYAFCFPLGAVIGFYYKRITKINVASVKKYLLVICMASTSIFLGIIYVYGLRLNIIDPLSIISLALAFMSLVGLLRLYRVKYLRLLEFIGVISYELYLFEAVFLWKYTFIFHLPVNKVLQMLIYLTLIVSLAIGYRYLFSSLTRACNRE